MNVWEIHPALVHFPIALLLSAVAVDVFAWWRPHELLNRVATGLLIGGTVSCWLAANFGLLAFYTVPAHTHEAHHLMFWHIGAAVSSLVLFTWLAVVRWFHRAEPLTRTRRGVGLVAAVFLMTTGALGGHIVYHGGAGVEPELLAESVRESHSHGGHDRVASRGEHDGHGRETRRSYYTAPPDRSDHAAGHEHGEKQEMPNHQGAAKNGKKKSATDHAGHEEKQDTEPNSKGEAHHKDHSHDESSAKSGEKKSETDHAGHDAKQDSDRNSKGETRAKDHSRDDGPATKNHEHDQSAEMDEQSEHEHGHSKKAAADKQDHQSHGHEEKRQPEESKPTTAGHQHNGSTTKNVPPKSDPPLGPDFEQNVQENRQRNMPKTGEHSKHGHDAKPKNSESETKHEH